MGHAHGPRAPDGVLAGARGRRLRAAGLRLGREAFFQQDSPRCSTPKFHDGCA